jgi:hypothetical protein
MKQLIKILTICMFIFSISPILASAESDVVNTFLHFTDSPRETTKTITEGDSIEITVTAYGNYGELSVQNLEIVGTKNLFTTYLTGKWQSDNTFYYTRTFAINTDSLKIPNGEYTIAFTVVDENNEWETSELTLIIIEKQDTTKPTISIQYPENEKIYNDHVNSFKFIAKDENLDTCHYLLNNNQKAQTSCQDNIQKGISISTIEGQNTLTVWAKDKYGNEAEKTITFSVSIKKPIDDVSPVVEIISPEEKLYKTKVKSATFKVVDDNLEMCWYKLNSRNIEFTSCELGILNEIQNLFTIEGQNTLTVWAKDKYGNTGSDNIIFEMDYGYKDNNPPIVNILNPENITYEEMIDNFKFRVEDEFLYSCWYSLNGIESEIQNCKEGLNIIEDPSINYGKNELIIYAMDSAINIGHDSVTFTIKEIKENEAPKIKIITPENNGKYKGDIIFEVHINEDVKVVYYLDDENSVTMKETSDLKFFSDELTLEKGEHKVKFCATDLGGLTSCKTVSFEILDDKDDKDCNSCKDKDWDTSYEEIDEFYKDKKELEDEKRRNVIKLDQEQPNREINKKFTEEIYYYIIASILVLIIIVLILLIILKVREIN